MMKRFRVVCAFFVALASARLAPANTYFWDGNGAIPPNGNFNVANNWNLNTFVPGSGDIAQFSLGGKAHYTVSFPGSGSLGMNPVNYVTDRLLVGNTNTVSFAQVNAFSTYAVNNATTAEAGRGIIIGQVSGDNATLNTTLTGVTGFSGVAATVGDAAGSIGTLNVSGSKFNLTGSSVADDELIIGNHGTGTLNVTAGAIVNLSYTSVLGKYIGSTGMATVSGIGSIWNSGSLSVGRNGAATLDAIDGGQVNCNGSMSVNGTLNIGGGQVSNDEGYIATLMGGGGTVNVDGLNSNWNNDFPLEIGYSGTGALNVTNGGKVTSHGTGLPSEGPAGVIGGSGAGTVTVDGPGSEWSLQRGIVEHFNDTVLVGHFGTGSLTVKNGGTVRGSVVTISPTGQVNGDGNFIESYTGYGIVMINYGIVAPGNSAGALHVGGGYYQRDNGGLSAGTLQIELGGTEPGTDYDQLLVTGTIGLTDEFMQVGHGGTLDVSLINGFTPHESDSFNILDFASLSGTFATVNLPALTGSLQWDTSQLYISGVLSVVLPGDYNGNGVLDAADYVEWRKDQGTTHTLLNDPIGGTIGMAQYNQWRAHFGQPQGSGSSVSASAAVPEPSTLLLLMLAAAGWCLLRGPAA
jgi:T5SS/PEP-CTERM-associated repeat protein